MKVHKISGNYQQVYNQLRKAGCQLFGELNTATTTSDYDLKVIEGDLPRTPLIGTRSDKKHWLDLCKNHHSGQYTQGDYSGASFSSILYCEKFLYEQESIDDSVELYSNNKKISFAYINNDNLSSGVTYHSNNLHPDYWVISVATKTNAALHERTISLYISDKLLKKLNRLPCNMVNFSEDFPKEVNSAKLKQFADSFKLDDDKCLLDVPENVNPQTLGSTLASQLLQEVHCDQQQMQVSKHLCELAKQGILLNQKGKNSDSNTVFELITNIQKKCHQYFLYDHFQLQKFKTECSELINNARTKLHQYVRLDRILVNLLIAILTLGVGYLAAGAIKYAVTGRFLLFSPKPHSQELLDQMADGVNCLKEPGI